MAKEKILIIKTGYAESLDYDVHSRKVSLGDVFRTTPLLHLFKDDNVSWVTDLEAKPLLENNPFIDRLMVFDQFLPFQLLNERFDTVINLEKVPGICAITDQIHAWKKYGFRFDQESGLAEAYDHAFDVLAVSANSELKRTNKKTAQELLFSMVGKSWNGEEYILGYVPNSKVEYDVALNNQIGLKWPNKAWPIEKWNKLEEMLQSEGFKVSRQDNQPKEVLTNLNSYMDWLNSARVLVSNDSLGLHLGIAMNKYCIGLFGPTPSSEVYFYGRGEAVIAPVSCDLLPCFKGECISGKNCISQISVESVFNKITDYRL